MARIRLKQMNPFSGAIAILNVLDQSSSRNRHESFHGVFVTFLLSGVRMFSHFKASRRTVFGIMFVLRFYGPVNPMGSCRARSVYLTTRLLGRLSPLSG